MYISENVGKCNRLDKCGYHYTPREYFTDNPRERDKYLVEDGSLRPCGYHYTPKQYFTDNPWKRDWECENVKYIGKFTYSHSHTPPPRPICTILVFEALGV